MPVTSVPEIQLDPESTAAADPPAVGTEMRSLPLLPVRYRAHRSWQARARRWCGTGGAGRNPDRRGEGEHEHQDGGGHAAAPATGRTWLDDHAATTPRGARAGNRACSPGVRDDHGVAIDPELVRALHVVPEDRRGGAADPAAAHHLFQTSTIAALMDSRYDGDLTVGEVMAHGDLGLGTLEGLDGELIIVDGQALVGRTDRSLSPVDPATTTPFAVVTPFAPGPPVALDSLDHADLLARLDVLAPATVSAVRVEGTFRRLRLRSVPRQQKPYPPLEEVVKEQAEWDVADVDAVVVGFRFPSEAAGLEVPGWHLHAMARDHSTGGHVLAADIAAGCAWLDATDEVHVELPPGVEIFGADAAMRAGIENAETSPGND